MQGHVPLLYLSLFRALRNLGRSRFARDLRHAQSAKSGKNKAAKTGKHAEPTGTPHVYKKVGDRELKLYVYQPDGKKPETPLPAIVFFHGGGWVGGGPAQFLHHCEYLAKRGMVAIEADYRHLGKDDKGAARSSA